MDLDAEFNRLRSFVARAEPVIAAYEASRGDGMGVPSGFTAEQWAELSRIEDRLGTFEIRLAPWEQGENSVPPIIQELAQRLIARIDQMDAKLAEVDKLAGEVVRLARMAADLAEVVENKAPLEPLPRHGVVPGEANGAGAPQGAPSSE